MFSTYFSAIFTAWAIGNAFPLPTLIFLDPCIKAYGLRRRELCCFIYQYQIFLLRVIAYPELAYMRLNMVFH